jgi:hypothetical protein
MLAGLLLGALFLPPPPAALAQTEEAKKTSSTGEFRAKVPNSKEQKVLLLIDGSRIRIEGYDGDEIVIRAPHRTAPPERAKGLRPLYYAAEDNSASGWPSRGKATPCASPKLPATGASTPSACPRRFPCTTNR